MRSRRSRVAWLVAAFIGIIALVTACGGGGSGQGSGGGPTPSKSTIKIGMLLPLTGVGGPSATNLKTTVEAWADWVNDAKGGINGHPVKLVIKDTKSEPAPALAAAKSLVENEKVPLIVSADPTTDLAAGKYLTNSGVPVMGFGYEKVWKTAPNYFATTAVNPVSYKIGMLPAMALGAKEFGAMACSEVPTCTSAESVYGPTSEKLGLRYNGTITASSTAPNYTAPCLKLMRQGTDYIELTFATSTVIRAAQDCVQQGYQGWFGLASASIIANKLNQAGDAKFAGYLLAWPWWADTAPAKQYRHVMEKYNSGNDYTDGNSSGVWAALEVFRKAAAHIGSDITPQTIKNALYTVKNETLGGMLPQPVTFTKGEPSPEIKCVFLFKLVDGKFSTVTAGGSGNGQQGDLQSSCYPPK